MKLIEKYLKKKFGMTARTAVSLILMAITIVALATGIIGCIIIVIT